MLVEKLSKADLKALDSKESKPWWPITSLEENKIFIIQSVQ